MRLGLTAASLVPCPSPLSSFCFAPSWQKWRGEDLVDFVTRYNIMIGRQTGRGGGGGAWRRILWLFCTCCLGTLGILNAPFLWNALPYNVASSTSLTSFKLSFWFPIYLPPSFFLMSFVLSPNVDNCSVFMLGTTTIGLPLLLSSCTCTQGQNKWLWHLKDSFLLFGRLESGQC